MQPSIKNDQGHSPTGNYALSRLNATRHGILSRQTVLPWESLAEYAELHGALKGEYEPVGPTEEHLVEEIAGVIWRKRRLRLAENAAYRDLFLKVITLSKSALVESGLIGLREPQGDGHLGMENIFTMKAEEVGEEIQKVHAELRSAQAAQKMLKTDGPEKYHRALETLSPGVRDLLEELGEGDSEPEELLQFLEWDVIPRYANRVFLLTHRSELLAQAQGKSFNPERLEKISRYEVSLDRKLEKTLAMLLKLQELRRQRQPALQLKTDS